MLPFLFLHGAALSSITVGSKWQLWHGRTLPPPTTISSSFFPHRPWQQARLGMQPPVTQCTHSHQASKVTPVLSVGRWFVANPRGLWWPRTKLLLKERVGEKRDGDGHCLLALGPWVFTAPSAGYDWVLHLGPGLQCVLKRYLPPTPLTLLPLQFLTNKDDLVNTKSKSSPWLFIGFLINDRLLNDPDNGYVLSKPSLEPLTVIYWL